MITLKLDNLTYGTSPDSPRRVGDVHITREPHTKAPRVFAFFRFHDQRDGEVAEATVDAAGLDRCELRGRGSPYRRYPNSRSPYNRSPYSQFPYRGSHYNRSPYSRSPTRRSHYRRSRYS
ncbi:Serine/arginine-rich splicing factor 8 [Plecturocebus cupreus]